MRFDPKTAATWLVSAALLTGQFTFTQSLAQVAPSAEESARYRGLHAAALRGDRASIEQGVRNGAQLEARDDHGRTPLHVATFAKQREAIRALIAAGAQAGALDDDRYDAVTIAAVANDEETLRLLLQLGASAKLVTSRYDGTALIAAAHLGHAGVVRQLIAAGAPLDHVNNLHWTAVIESIVLGDGGVRHQDTLRALVAAGADLQLTDAQGRTPLMLARDRGYAKMVTLLEKASARRGATFRFRARSLQPRTPAAPDLAAC
ncbi:MAG: ankyrin repeat domain-containing protein [Pseudomonadota bacterium]|nr:ankyrin repeat domain-containing protein [Pseudomonadota bacterium]